MTTTAAPLFLFLTAMPAMSGVLIGHPGHGVIASDSSVVLETAEMPVSRIDYVSDDGTVQEVHVNETLDVLEGSPIAAPTGVFYGATIHLSGPIRVTGFGNGGTFGLEINVGAIFLDMPHGIEVPQIPSYDPQWTIQFGYPGWITADLLGLEPDNHVTIDAGDELHDTLRNALRYGSTWN